MKADIHPNYRFILVRDISCNFEFLTRSTVKTEQKATYNGKEYDLFVIDISSESHPFYTGQQKVMDAEGRVEKYYRKYGFSKSA